MTWLISTKGDSKKNLGVKYTTLDWGEDASTQLHKMFLLANLHVYDYESERSVNDVFTTLFDFT